MKRLSCMIIITGLFFVCGISVPDSTVATCITGFSEYRHYFDMDEGMSVYNIHIVLATLATAGFVATAIDANINDDDGHAGLGIGSTVLMAVPIVILHF